MVQKLADRLKSQPEDVEGWAMLGRSHSILGQYPQAVTAFQRVITLRPDDAQGHADLADAMGMAAGRKLDGEPEKLIAKALQLDPGNVKALGLAGTIALQRGDAAQAAKHWELALRKVEPGSEMASNLLAAANEARQKTGQPPLPAPAAVAAPGMAAAPAMADGAKPAPPAAPGTGTVQVRITLAPALAAKAAPDDTLFIFARAPQGGRAPLAILRKQVRDLPLAVTLDDSLAMSPAMRLSSVTQVVVGARISKSGNAMPQPGDLQGLSAVVPVGTQGMKLEINEALP
jgi:cytochrome c-type biogenesis protein CcmH